MTGGKWFYVLGEGPMGDRAGVLYRTFNVRSVTSGEHVGETFMMRMKDQAEYEKFLKLSGTRAVVFVLDERWEEK